MTVNTTSNKGISSTKAIGVTIKTTSFIPPSVIKLHLLFAHAFTCFGLCKPSSEGHQLFKRKLPLHDTQLHSIDLHIQVKMRSLK
jgi:hypothetical protein